MTAAAIAAPSSNGAPAALAEAETLLRLGDTALILGHRLSEWTGHAPALEIDMALANVALDLIGQARNYLTLAGLREGRGRDEDALAYLRDVRDYRNLLLVEQPNGDFARTIARQFLFDQYNALLLKELTASRDPDLAAIAAKAVKESAYHAEFSAEWVVRLGDGTAESRRRIQTAFDDLWSFTGEMFATDAVDQRAIAAGIIPDPATFRDDWVRAVEAVLAEATLARPADGWMQAGGKTGRHSEHLGFLLAEMQVLPRAHPGATW